MVTGLGHFDSPIPRDKKSESKAMANHTVYPIVLCGGSGTRLWPLSRKSYPKQFVPLLEEQSLLGLTLQRLSYLSKTVGCVASEEHRFLVAEEMRHAGLTGPLVLEPSARNTAAAMALAALHANPDDLLLFCPADHYIPNTEAFAQMVHQGAELASAGSIVLFGVRPTYPATGYGYIQVQGQDVLRFVEKPDRVKAEALLCAGNNYWNAGIFLSKASVLLNALRTHAPDILSGTEEALRSGGSESFEGFDFIRPEAKAFGNIRSESIDYAVMEKAKGLKLLPFAGDWSDVGSWAAVAELVPTDATGNQPVGNALMLGSSNTFVHSPHRPTVALGVQDLVIVDTPDALLVAHKDKAEDVKQAVAALQREGSSLAVMHRKVARPWGWYDSVDAGERFQVKRISVKPGASLSLQMHHHRAEHWIVVRGTAKVVRGEEELLISENESVYIPLGVKHRLENPGKTDLEIIEVQSGSYLGEDDIVRFEDKYGR